MRFLNEVALSAADVSSDQAGGQVDGAYLIAASIQAKTTGAPVGTLKLQGSNNGTDWSDLATVAVSAAAVYMIPKTDLCYRYVRPYYAKTSGTGTITATLQALGF